jgi:hypothetical protein
MVLPWAAAHSRKARILRSLEDLAALRAIARSRTEPASRVERARMLLAYRENPLFFAVGRALSAATAKSGGSPAGPTAKAVAR